MGVLKWVDWTVSEPRYFQLQTDHTPVHLALLDEVGGPRGTDGAAHLSCQDSRHPRQELLGTGLVTFYPQ